MKIFIQYFELEEPAEIYQKKMKTAIVSNFNNLPVLNVKKLKIINIFEHFLNNTSYVCISWIEGSENLINTTLSKKQHQKDVKSLILRLGVLTVETNRDRDRDVLTRWDVIFQTVKKISTVETDFFLASRSRQKSRNLNF